MVENYTIGALLKEIRYSFCLLLKIYSISYTLTIKYRFNHRVWALPLASDSQILDLFFILLVSLGLLRYLVDMQQYLCCGFV